MTRFTLQPAATAFDLGNALALSRAAELAYDEPEKIGETLGNWGFGEPLFFDNEGTQAFVGVSDDTVLLSFRGTQPKETEDIVADVKVKLRPGPAGEVHDGFHNALEAVWGEMLGEIRRLREEKPGRPLWVTGHSLGAALATLATARLELEEGLPVQGLYTFGSPRVGDREFAVAFETACGARCFRFVNNNDVVTRVPIPLRLFPYKHVGMLRYLDVKGRLRDAISAWRRLLDRLRGRVRDLGKLGTDGMKDHAIQRYVAHLERASATPVVRE